MEQVAATSQMGTHMDGLNHLHRHGIESLPQVVTRGLLLDVARGRSPRGGGARGRALRVARVG